MVLVEWMLNSKATVIRASDIAMRFLLLATTLMLSGCGRMSATTPQERFDTAQDELRAAKSDEERFYALNDAAKEGFVLGKTEAARKHAEELLNLLPKFKDNWNYGNAVQDANMVLGRIAVVDGRLDEAKQFLIKAGRVLVHPKWIHSVRI